MKKKDTNKQQDAISRRAFLRRSIVIGAGTAGAAALPTQSLAETIEVPETVSKKDGYRVTEHIADYYKSAEV